MKCNFTLTILKDIEKYFQNERYISSLYQEEDKDPEFIEIRPMFKEAALIHQFQAVKIVFISTLSSQIL
jgi:hypothetical protein